MYPIAHWPEDVFLSFYTVLFVIMFVVADSMKFRTQYVRPVARWGIGATVAVLAILHLLTDVGTPRINQHWVGRAPAAADFGQASEEVNDETYQKYWGENRRWIPWVARKTGRRLAILPYIFLGVFIAANFFFHHIRPQPELEKNNTHG